MCELGGIARPATCSCARTRSRLPARVSSSAPASSTGTHVPGPVDELPAPVSGSSSTGPDASASRPASFSMGAALPATHRCRARRSSRQRSPAAGRGTQAASGVPHQQVWGPDSLRHRCPSFALPPVCQLTACRPLARSSPGLRSEPVRIGAGATARRLRPSWDRQGRDDRRICRYHVAGSFPGLREGLKDCAVCTWAGIRV